MVGSGQVKATCKTVGAVRFKCSGARWQESGAATLLKVRARSCPLMATHDNKLSKLLQLLTSSQSPHENRWERPPLQTAYANCLLACSSGLKNTRLHSELCRLTRNQSTTCHGPKTGSSRKISSIYGLHSSMHKNISNHRPWLCLNRSHFPGKHIYHNSH